MVEQEQGKKYTAASALCHFIFIAMFVYIPCRGLPAPGIAVAILGIAAVVIAVRAPYMGRKEEIVWILIAFAIGIVEIYAIKHDREDQDHKHEAELRTQEGQFQQQMNFLLGFKSSVISELEEANANLAKAKIAFPANSLKVTTLQLSTDVLDFINNAEENTPKIPLYSPPELRKAVMDAYSVQLQDYEDKIKGDFHKKFDQRAIDLFSILKKKKIDFGSVNLEATEALCRAPVNSSVIGWCGQNLRIIGNSIKN